MSNFVPGVGNGNAQLAFVGEAPGYYEDKRETPFVNSGEHSAGYILDEILEQCGISRGDIYLTNVYKYRPPDNKIHRIKEVCDPEQQIQNLFRELDQLPNLNCIVALGNTPLNVLTGKKHKITDARGSIYLSPYTGKKVIGTYHPAAFLYQKGESEGESGAGQVPYSYKYISVYDIQKAIRESKTDSYEIPSRDIIICRDSADVWKYLNDYQDSIYSALDIEAIRCIPVCLSIACNPFHAIVFPLISLHKFQGHWAIPQEELIAMQRLTIEFLNDTKRIIIGQNFKYDQPKLEDTCGWLKFLRKEIQVIDTTILAHSLWPEFPKNLGFLSSMFTRQPYYKYLGKEFDYKKQDFKVLFNYCGLDTTTDLESFSELTKELKELKVPGFPNWYSEFIERIALPQHYFYKEMEEIGLRVDMEVKKKYIEKYKIIYKEMRTELNTCAGFECNPHSNRDVPQLLYRYLKLPVRKDCSRQSLVAMLNNTVKTAQQKRCIELILDSRRVRKARTTYYEAEIDYDGRMRTSYNPNGTKNGRSTNNILEPPLRPKKIGIAFQTMTKHGDIGHELREIFIPDDGYCFIETDLSQAEARVVAILSKDYDLLRKFESGIDVHSEMAFKILGRKWNGERASKEDRFLGKKGRHSRNYDVQKRTAMQDWNAEAKKLGIKLNVSEYRAGQILDIIRQETPLVEQVFHQEIQRALAETRVLISPFGRRREFFGRFDEEMFREGYAAIPQGTVIDHLRLACYDAKPKLNRERYAWVLESHDSITALVRIGYEKEYTQTMNEYLNRKIDFSRCSLQRGELHIPCEHSISYTNLKDMEEFKL